MAKLKASKSDACYDSESEPDKGNDKGKKIWCGAQRRYRHQKYLEGGTQRSRGGASLLLSDVGKGFPTTVHYR